MDQATLKLFVVEYSISQDAFHVYSLRAMVKNNHKNLSRGQSSDFVPIGIFQSREQAESFQLKFMSQIADIQAEYTADKWVKVGDVLKRLLPIFFSGDTPD